MTLRIIAVLFLIFFETIVNCLFNNVFQRFAGRILTSKVEKTVIFNSSILQSRREGLIIDDDIVLRLVEPKLLKKAKVNILNNHIRLKWDLKSLNPSEINLNSSLIIERNIAPALFLINSKSGGKLGKRLVQVLLNALKLIQVCDLRRHDPIDHLSLYKNCSQKLQLICCGGDGTINWIVENLIKLHMDDIPIRLLPLGTGNDLYSYSVRTVKCRSNSSIIHANNIIHQLISNPLQFLNNPSFASISTSTVSNMNDQSPSISQSNCPSLQVDRWNISITTIARKHKSRLRQIIFHKFPKTKVFPLFFSKIWSDMKPIIVRKFHFKSANKTKIMLNYFGIGVDGAVSIAFDKFRGKYPFLFVSRLVNKFWYGLLGLVCILRGRHHDLSDCLELTCDGKRVLLPKKTYGIILLNINSYAGGARLWTVEEQRSAKTYSPKHGSSAWRPLSANDQILEVVGVSGIAHLGAIKAGLSSPTLLAQGREISFETKKKLPMQIDGEPWIQKKCSVGVSCGGSVKILI